MLPISSRLREVLGEYVGAFVELRDIAATSWPKAEPEYPPTLNQTLRYFVDVMMMMARASYTLLLNDAYWDSEIILRSLYEAFARCLTFATSEEPSELLREFWSDQLADKTDGCFSTGDPGRSVMALLSDENLMGTPRTSNKRSRRALDQKWSFFELVEALSKADDGRRYSNANSLLHMYGMQSAIAHVSAKFYDLLWDRNLRETDRETLEDGHYCRQMSDATWLTAVAMDASLRTLNVSEHRSEAPLLAASKFSDHTASYTAAFNDSQAAFYTGHGYPYEA